MCPMFETISCGVLTFDGFSGCSSTDFEEKALLLSQDQDSKRVERERLLSVVAELVQTGQKFLVENRGCDL